MYQKRVMWRVKGPYIDKGARLDTDREGAHMCHTSLEFDSIRHGRETKDTCTRGEEVTSIVIGMETYEITVQDPKQNLTSNGQNSMMYA